MHPAGSMREHQRVGLRRVLDPRTARDHVVGVDVEDELRPRQRLLAGRGVLGRRHVEPSAAALGATRPARATAGDEQPASSKAAREAATPRRPAGIGGGRRRAAAPTSSMDARTSVVDRPVPGCLRGGDELTVGDRPGREREMVVLPITLSAGKRPVPAMPQITPDPGRASIASCQALG